MIYVFLYVGGWGWVVDGSTGVARDPPVELDRTFENTREYAREVGRVGEKEGIPVVDVWTKLWEGAGQDERALNKYLYDGLHLNEAGYAVRGPSKSNIRALGLNNRCGPIRSRTRGLSRRFGLRIQS